MISKACLAAILSLALGACTASNVAPYLVYTAQFNSRQIADAEDVMNIIGRKWKLKVFEKDKQTMRAISHGKDAFFIALHNDPKKVRPVVVLTNNPTSEGDTLSLYVMDFGELPVSELEKLANDVIEKLGERGVELQLSSRK